MANRNQIKFGVGYEVDKSSVQQVKKSLQDLQNIKLQEFSGNVKQFVKMKEAAQEVRVALNKAFNVKINSLNTQKFNQELGLSTNKINQLYSLFSKGGAIGQRAFSDLSSSILTTNMKLKQTKSLITSMGETMANTVKWGIASSVMNSFTNSVRQAFQYVKSLDSALTDIRIVTGDSTEKMKQFAVQANQAAQALGRSTMDYSKAALTFYQQGLNDEDVQARTQATLVAQNITGAGEEMADYLTAVWNGYKVANEEAELYVDKLAAVADSSASNMAQLATAMSKVASTANMLGVPVDKLNAQIATITATTRQAPETVGNALKTIYARINDIATGADDAQISLGNYSSKMAEVGFSVLDASGHLRDTGDVIDEIGAKWSTLSREQQIYLARTMAGQRQYNNLLALFENWSRYTDLVTVSMDSQGAAMEKNERYLDSLAAKLEQFGAAGERVKSAFVDENDLKGIVDFGTSLVNVFASLIQSIGGGKNAVLALGSIFTQVFGNTIAKEVNNIITHFQDVNTNAKMLQQQLDSIQIFKLSNGINEKGTQAMVKQLEAAQAYYKFMTPAQINEYNQTVQQIGQLETEADTYKKLEGQARQMFDLYQKQSKFDTFEGFSQAIEREITPALSKLKMISADDPTGLQKSFTELRTKLAEVGVDIRNFQGGKDLYEMFNQMQHGVQFSKDQLEKFKQKMLELGQTSILGSQNIQEIDQLARKFGISRDKAQLLQQQLEKTRQELKQFSEVKTFVNMAGAIGGIASAINSVVNLTKVWKNENLSAGQKILQTFTNLGFVVGMFATNLSKLRDGFTLLITKLLMSSSAMGTLAMSEAAATAQTTTLTGAFAGLNKVLKANPIVLIITGLVAAVTAGIAIYNKLHMSVKEATQAIETFSNKQKQALEKVKEFSQGKASLQDVAQEYQELAKKAGAISFDNKIDELTEKERERYNQLKGIITQYNEDAIIGYNDQGQAILKNNDILRETIQLLKQKHQEEIDSTYDSKEFQQAQRGRQTEYKNAKNIISEKQGKINSIQNEYNQGVSWNEMFSGLLYSDNGIQTVTRGQEAFQEKITKIIEIQQQGVEHFSENKEQLNNLINDIIQLGNDSGNDFIIAQAENYKQAIASIEQYSQELSQAQDELVLAEQDLVNKSKLDIQSLLGLLQTTGNNQQYNQLAELYGESFVKSLVQSYSEGLSRANFPTETSALQNIKEHLLKPLQDLFSKKEFQSLQTEISESFSDIDLSSLNAQEYYNQILQIINQIFAKNQKLQQLAKENPQTLKSILSTLFNIDNIKFTNEHNQTRIKDFTSQQTKENEDIITDAINEFKQFAKEKGENQDIIIPLFSQVQLEAKIKETDIKDLQNFSEILANIQLKSGMSADELASAYDKAIVKVKLYQQTVSQLGTLSLLGNKENLKDQDLTELQNQLNKIAETYPRLRSAVAVLNNEWLEGTTMYQRALHDVNNQILENTQNAISIGVITKEEASVQVSSFIKDVETLQSALAKDILTNEDYTDSLLKLASQYDSCSQELNKFLLALNSGNEETLQYAQANLEVSLRIAQLAKITGISADQIEKVAQQLAGSNAYLQNNSELAADAAVRYIKLNSAIAELYDDLDNYKQLMAEINQSGMDSIYMNSELFDSFSEMKTLIADLFDTSSQLLGDDWIVKNMQNIFNMVETGGEGLEQLRKLAAEEILINLGIDFEGFEQDKEEFLNSIAQLEEGAQLSIDDTLFLQQLVTAMEAAGYSQEYIENALSGLNVDVDLVPYEEGLNQAIDKAIQAGDLMDISVAPTVDLTNVEDGLNSMIQQYGEAGQLAADEMAANSGVDTKITTKPVSSQNSTIIPGQEFDVTYAEGHGTVPMIRMGAGPFAPMITGVQQIPFTTRYPVYIPRANTQQVKGESTVVGAGLEVIGPHKSSGGKVSHYNSPAARQNRAARSTKPSSGGGGGKGSGGSTKQPSIAKLSTDEISAKPKDYLINPYEAVEKSYDRQETKLKTLDNLQKKLVGKDRLDNLTKQNKELEKQNEIIKKRKKISEDIATEGTTANLKKQIQDTFGPEAFDKNNELNQTSTKNVAVKAYNDQLAKQTAIYEADQAAYNKWIQETWNQYSGEEQEAYKKDKQLKDEQLKNSKKTAEDNIKIAEEEYNKKIKLIDNYKKALEQDEKFHEQYIDNLRKIIENNISKSKIKVDLSLDFGQLEREFQEFDNKVIKKISKEDILGNAKASAEQIKSYFDSKQLTNLAKRIKNITKEIQIIQAGGYSELYGLSREAYEGLTDAEREALRTEYLQQAKEDLQNYTKEYMKQVEKIKDFRDSIYESYLDSIDDVKDKMGDVVDQYERINDLTEHNIKLTQLLYGDNAGYDILDKYYEKQAKNNAAQMKSLQEQKRYWEEQLSTVEVGSDPWKKFKANLDDTVDQINSLLETQLENIAVKFENKIQKAIKNISTKLTQGLGNDYLEQEWDYISKDDDAFLDIVNSKFGIDEVERLYSDAAAALAGSPAQQKKINKLMNDQLKLLREKDKLTQYDIDRAKAALELEKARMALEEARANKSKMRLRRDSQGNYTYQYVADEEKLSDLQSALADAQSQLYNLDKEHYQQQLNQMYSTYKDYMQKMAELERQYAATTDETEKKRLERQMDLLRDKYSEYFDNISQDLQFTLTEYLTKSFGQAMNVNMEDYSPAQQIEILKENLPYTNSQMQILSEEIQRQGGIVKATAQYYKELRDAANEAAAATQQALNEAGTSQGEIDSGQNKDIDLTEQYIQDYKKAAEAAKQVTEQVKTLLQTIDQFLNKNLSENSFTKMLQEAYQTLQNINSLEGTTGAKILDIFGEGDASEKVKNKNATSEKLQTQFNKKYTKYEEYESKGMSIVSAINSKKLENLTQDQVDRYLKALMTYDTKMTNLSNSMGNIKNTAEEKNVSISVSFPNATDHNEILEAIKNLENRAAQTKNKKAK